MVDLLSVKPFGNQLLVRKFPDEWRSKGGLLLAYKANTFLGTVLAVGEGRRKKKGGGRRAIEVKPSDTILFKEFAGHWRIDKQDDRLIILDADEVEAIVYDPTLRVEVLLDY